MATSAKRYWVRKLPSAPPFSSLPLVVPNNTNYDPEKNKLYTLEGVKRDKVKIVQEALQLLQSIKKDVAILSIAGPCRSGKSYILSRLLGESNAFELGHTMDAKTLGIWMGTSVLECDDHVVVLLDTEGIDAATSSGQEDTRIFVLTLLLSSYFIYNSVGVVKKSDLDKMTFFTKVADSIKIKQESSKNSQEKLQNYLPNFLWLLRDVFLRVTDEDGSEITPKQFLLRRVLVKSTHDSYASDKVSQDILSHFASIDCVTLPFPSIDESIMTNIEMNIDNLNPKFNEQVDALVRKLKEEVTTKTAFDSGEPVNGFLLASFAERCIEEINDPNNTPTLANTWENAIKNLASDTQEKLKEEYIEEFTEAMKKASSNDGPLEENEICAEGQSTMTTMFGIHHVLMKDKNAKLIEKVGRFCVTRAGVGPEYTQERLLEEFKKKIIQVKKRTFKDQSDGDIVGEDIIGGVLFSFIQENHKRSHQHCSKVFDDHYTPIKRKALDHGGDYTFSNLLDDIKKFEEMYFSEAIGPAKWEVYGQKKILIEADEATFRCLEGYQQKLMKLHQEIAESNRRNQEMFEDIIKVREQMKNETIEHQENINQIQRQYAEAIEKFLGETKRRSELEERKFKDMMEAQRELYLSSFRNEKERTQENEAALKDIVNQQQEVIATMKKTIENIQIPPPPRSLFKKIKDFFF